MVKILILSTRPDLLKYSVASLIERIGVATYELVIVNHTDTINIGYKKLYSHIKPGEIILSTEDDFLFTDEPFLQDAIDGLNYCDLIRLRMDGDGQKEEKTIRSAGNVDIVTCWRGGFTFNPFLAKAETILKLLPIPDIGDPEPVFCERFKGIVGKLRRFKKRGVAIHTGLGRGLHY